MITAYRDTAENVREQIRNAEIDVGALRTLVKACEISRCRATCCHDGVYLTTEEKRGVEKLVTEQRDYFTKAGLQLPQEPIISVRDGSAWKTATRPAELAEIAIDYPAHFSKTRCVFLDSEGYCGIQRWSMEQGKGDWFDKPLTCWIHPLIILPKNQERKQPLLTLVSPENDPQKTDDYPGFASCTHCGRPDADGAPAYIALNAELEALSMISGRDLIHEIETS